MKPPGRLRHWPDYKYLFAWLQVATKGLSDESRARTREEITDHFHQAIDEGLRAGLTEDAATGQAVEGLGRPKAARRAFRRTYLTRWQANIVRSFSDAPKPATSSTSLWQTNPRRRLFMATILVVGVAAMTALDPRLSTAGWRSRAGVVALMLVATIVLAAVPGLYRRGRERAAIALGASAEMTLWGGFLMLSAASFESRRWFLLLFVIFFAAVYLPLLRKLSKYREAT